MRHLSCTIVIAGVLGIMGMVMPVEAAQVLIHAKTSLAQDDAQLCVVPNVAWAMAKVGHQVTILVDASAVTDVTKGYGLFNRLFRPALRDWSALGYPNVSGWRSRSSSASRSSRSPTITASTSSSSGNRAWQSTATEP